MLVFNPSTYMDTIKLEHKTKVVHHPTASNSFRHPRLPLPSGLRITNLEGSYPHWKRNGNAVSHMDVQCARNKRDLFGLIHIPHVM
jgi:hypothetical protein